MIKKIIAVLLFVLALSACGGSEDAAITGCNPVGELEAVCGLQAPEDLAVIPGERFILLSQFGGVEGHAPGNIALLDTTDRSVSVLFPDGSENTQGDEWGDSSCALAPDEQFSPHGTHLHQLDDGRWRYAVVNHGGREAIELFELTSLEQPQLQWRGCVSPSENTIMNDVVGLANGDLVYTRMFPADDSLAMIKSILGFDTGEAWYWNRETGLRALPETNAAMPNGIEISADERFVFINRYMSKEVHKYDLQTNSVVGSAAVPNVDNSAWSPDGKLWLASHVGGIGETMACYENQPASCGAAFEIVELDPDTMQFQVVFRHQGAPMGVATVAVAAGDKVYLGSYTGDRLLIVPLDLFSASN
jgi:hypothetical protein